MVDRIGHKRASIIADLVSGLTVALIPILYITVDLSFWQLLALVFMGALLDTPGAAARGALIPDVAALAGMRLEQVNAAFETVGRASLLIGPLLAGGLISLVGASNVLLIDAFSFVVSAVLVALAVPALRQAPSVPQHYLADALSGLRFIVRQPLIRTIVISATIANFLTSPLFAVAIPVFIKQTTGSAGHLGMLLAAFGAGAAVGAIVYGVAGRRWSRRALLIGGFFGDGLSIALLATLPPFPIMVVVITLGAITIGPLNPLIRTVLQERTPTDMRARVFGTVTALALVATPLGMLIAAYLLQILSIQQYFAVIATCSISLAVGMLTSPTLLEINVRQ